MDSPSSAAPGVTPEGTPAPSTGEADELLAALSRMRGRRWPRDGANARGLAGISTGGRGEEHGEHTWPHDPEERREHSERPGHRDHRAPHGQRGRMGGPALLRMLSTLAHAEEPLTVSALAEQIGVDQPRASRLVQQAVEHGHVAREADPNDARRTRVRLTETGERTVHGFRSRQRDEASTALAALTPTEREALVSLVTKLAAAWPER